MATLSLKKAKLIGETPSFDLPGKFVVMRHARKERSLRFTCCHDTQDLAEKEAERLCKTFKSERFLVLKIESTVEWEEV